MLQSIQANVAANSNDTRHANAMPPLNAFLAQIFNPANATHGDTVYTEEAMDRIITHLMEQTTTSSAPGPASASAIAALPKQKADKEMMGQDGKAECSVCMDAVEVGDEVTVLPCKHWFHGDCVGAWLKEHDTCPHCRQGIMRKEREHNAPRSPHQPPRNFEDQFPIYGNFRAQGSNGRNGNGTGNDDGNGNGYINGVENHSEARNRTHQSFPGALSQPGMQQPYVPGIYASYPDSRNFAASQGQPQGQQSPQASSQRQDGHRRRSSARERSNNGGEGSSQGVTGWLRSFRGGSGGGR